jgi:hypothetical protein
MKLIRTLLAAATVAAAMPALGAVAIATAVPNAHKVPPNFNVVTRSPLVAMHAGLGVVTVAS